MTGAQNHLNQEANFKSNIDNYIVTPDTIIRVAPIKLSDIINYRYMRGGAVEL